MDQVAIKHENIVTISITSFTLGTSTVQSSDSMTASNNAQLLLNDDQTVPQLTLTVRRRMRARWRRASDVLHLPARLWAVFGRAQAAERA